MSHSSLTSRSFQNILLLLSSMSRYIGKEKLVLPPWITPRYVQKSPLKQLSRIFNSAVTEIFSNRRERNGRKQRVKKAKNIH